MKDNGIMMIGLLLCSLWTTEILLVPGQVMGRQTIVRAGKVIFEDKQAGVKIIQTREGVILKITTDKYGRKTVIEVDSDLTR